MRFLAKRLVDVQGKGVKGSCGCFYQLGGPFCGCPCNEGPVIWAPYQRPGFL